MIESGIKKRISHSFLRHAKANNINKEFSNIAYFHKNNLYMFLMSQKIMTY